MKAVDIAKRLRSHVNSRGGPAKGENGENMGTVWPMMLEAADELEQLDKAWKEWRSIAERLQDDLRTGKRTYDFSFLGEDVRSGE